MVNKITTPPTQNEVIDKINELVDDKQDTLVSGTNIKTINNQSILGSGNIAGTQVLYSTTGNNTNGAMTQKATTTQLNLKANDADVVHKTGNETIGGEKTFTNIINQKTAYDVTNTSTSSYGIIKEIYDKNGEEIGVECVEMRNNILTHYIDSRRTVNGQWYGSGLYARLDLSTFNAWAEAPSSDVNGSIVTTVAKSKTQNGYFKLGNGLIIQFGLVTNMSNNKAKVNFSIPFTAVPQVVTTSDMNGVNDGYNSYISGTTTTGFNVFNKEYGTSVNCWVHWIAIGY